MADSTDRRERGICLRGSQEDYAEFLESLALQQERQRAHAPKIAALRSSIEQKAQTVDNISAELETDRKQLQELLR